ncbi:hypothetical protein LK07_15060 [Streptomyces pluripotens]|uniref:Uncharacterized protein n=1 Tax=Streptomyces pluripotens TaxID=1355015 RepID=A0A221NYS5_9ACTN|nr:hypothetical protein LK07_15060 [Streptomyces pluripotens]
MADPEGLSDAEAEPGEDEHAVRRSAPDTARTATDTPARSAPAVVLGIFVCPLGSAAGISPRASMHRDAGVRGR